MWITKVSGISGFGGLLAWFLVWLFVADFSAHAQQIAFTWDDLPAHSLLPQGQSRLQIANTILAAMRDHHLPPAYGFVNGIRVEREPGSEAVLEAWRRGGYPLGNHTWSHLNLNERTVAEFMLDTHRNENLLQKYMPVANYRWLRYPYLAEGESAEKRAAVRAQLALAGYRVAAVTMSFGDYAWNEPYARCLAKSDDAAIRRLESTYLQAADDTLTRTRAMSHTLAGHDVPYVLLMHVGAFDARMLPRLLDLYERREMHFITLEQAESDPFYREDVDLSLPSAAPTSLEAALRARGLAVAAALPAPDIANLCR